MNVLVVEDEDPKLEAILKFLHDRYPDCESRVARSVKSGVRAIREQVPDVLLLDISLPTFDISGVEPGGRPQGFGGVEVVRYADSLDVSAPTIIVSAYEAFARDGRNVQLKAITSDLSRDYPAMIRGVVYFNPVDGSWIQELSDLIRSLGMGGAQ